MRTQKEIQSEIEALEECKGYAPKQTMFGDNNHAKIDLQIEYLKGGIDTASEEFKYFSDDEQSAIIEAEEWESGDSDERPSAGWDIFKKKAKK